MMKPKTKLSCVEAQNKTRLLSVDGYKSVFARQEVR